MVVAAIGTEAAAASAVMMEVESIPTLVDIKRPFVIVIQATTDGSILFVG